MTADLPVGIVAEPTLVSTSLKIGAGALGLLFLLAGKRFPRLVSGAFWLALGAAVGLQFGAQKGYPLALFAALVVYAVGAAITHVVPRLGFALVTVWVAPAVAGGYLMDTGSFAFPFGATLTATAGLFLAALLLPRLALSVLSSALGVLLLEAAFGFEIGFAPAMALGLASAAWQAFFVAAPEPPPHGRGFSGTAVRYRGKRWLSSLGWAAGALLSLFVFLAVFSPRVTAPAVPDPARLRAAVQDGSLSAPGLVFSVEDAYYLCGRAYAISLWSPNASTADRLLVLVRGADPHRALDGLRAVKAPSEIEKMRRAAAITSQAFADVQGLIRPGVNESEVDRAISDSFARHGATGMAFPNLVGSGHNSVMPHYQRNCAVMRGGLVVVDIGCAYQNYASDMTRTFPVSGTWTPEQRELAEVVVASGDAARAVLKAGVTVHEVNRAARDVIVKAGWGDYYPHSVGHTVGLNVHDSWAAKLEAGAVFTIEPGIYIPRGARVDPKYWDLGVRVEDTYLVTPDGCEELTHFPKIPER